MVFAYLGPDSRAAGQPLGQCHQPLLNLVLYDIASTASKSGGTPVESSAGPTVIARWWIPMERPCIVKMTCPSQYKSDIVSSSNGQFSLTQSWALDNNAATTWTMFSGQTMVGYCILPVFVVSTPFNHQDLDNLSCLWSYINKYVVALSLSRSKKIVACPPLLLPKYLSLSRITVYL